jgi:hypothetical protein
MAIFTTVGMGKLLLDPPPLHSKAPFISLAICCNVLPSAAGQEK